MLLASIVNLALDPPSLGAFAGLTALVAAALLAETSPVPVPNLPAGHVSLASVFFVGAGVLNGPAEAALLAAAVRIAVDLSADRPWVRLVYNASAYALAAAAAGAVATMIGTDTVTRLVLAVVCAAATYYVVNVTLVSAAIGRWTGRSFFPLLKATAVATVLPFAIMVSGALMLVVLWQRSPLLTLALVGPLLAVALYQRSVHEAIVATQLALTDPLTSVGNQRHFNERLQSELDAAERDGTPLAVCLLDVDGLKHVNDTKGHPEGDRLLVEVASSLRQGGEAFRVGGDEFALLLPGLDEAAALQVGRAVVGRVAKLEVRLSCGVALFPAVARNDLYRAADDALYQSKRAGEAEVVVFGASTPPEVRSISGGP